MATSSRFPAEHIDTLRKSLVGLPPKVALHWLGADGGLPRIANTRAFQRLWARDVVGTEDPSHTPEGEQSTVDLLNAWAADADYFRLPTVGSPAMAISSAQRTTATKYSTCSSTSWGALRTELWRPTHDDSAS